MSDTRTCDVVVIGAGTAGLSAWRAATEAGANALIIERGPGGTTCARVGCMPSKLLLAAGRAARDARRAGLFGVRTEAVEVDGAAVLARVRAERDYFVEEACKNWSAVPRDRRMDGSARFVGPMTLQVEGGPRIEAGAVVVATGARPVVPPVLGPVRDRVVTHETVFEIERPPERLAVLGAGPLGLELAQAFAWLGSQVTVIDSGPVVASLSDPEAARVAGDAFGRVFDLRLDTELVSAEPVEGGARLRWAGGEGVFDLVLAASGRPPELKPLDLAAAGLELDEHGTPSFDPVTRRCGGSDVFMAGDAGGDRPVLHEASRQGETAGALAAGGQAKSRPPNFSIAFTDPEIVLVGCDHGGLPEGRRIGQASFGENGRVRIDDGPGAPGIARLYADGNGQLLGGVLVGPGAEHLGHLLTLAVGRAMTAAELADQAFYHPCLEEVLQNAARDLLD